MRKVRGNIQKGDEMVLDDIEISLDESTDPGSGLKSWSGTFTLPSGKYLEPGDECRLLLADSRSGGFFVKRVNIGTGHPDVVHFIGSGGLE
jgi:hypothetical protein